MEQSNQIPKRKFWESIWPTNTYHLRLYNGTRWFAFSSIMNDLPFSIWCCLRTTLHMSKEQLCAWLARHTVKTTEKPPTHGVFHREASNRFLKSASVSYLNEALRLRAGWPKAGHLHWDVLDKKGNVRSSEDVEKLPVWSFAVAYARTDGHFVIPRGFTFYFSFHSFLSLRTNRALLLMAGVQRTVSFSSTVWTTAPSLAVVSMTWKSPRSLAM